MQLGYAEHLEPLRLRGGLLALAIVVLALDQLSKFYVESVLAPYEQLEVFSFFSWVLVYNEGAAFSFLSDAGGWQRWLFAGVSVLVILWLSWTIVYLGLGERLMALGYALILGGALGNLWDRIAAGKVTDFILVHYGDWYFPAFNIADSAITAGVLCCILAILRQRPQEAT